MAIVQVGSSVWRLAALAQALCAATTAASGLGVGVGKKVEGGQRALFSPRPGGPAQNWTRTKMYRITPIEDTGVANMDTADAAGDVWVLPLTFATFVLHPTFTFSGRAPCCFPRLVVSARPQIDASD